MKKLLLVFFAVILLVSCKKNISILNEEYKRPLTAIPSMLFANAQKELADAVATPDINLSVFRLIAQHWTQTTYFDESKYNFDRRQVAEGWWGLLYRDVLRDLDETKRLTTAQDTVLVNPKIQKNQLALAEILEVYTYAILVNTFGNIPYTEALNINILNPKYDDAKTIYYDLLARLDKALSNLDPAEESFGASDLLFGGNIASWEKFGNSLKLKLGMILADSDPTKAQQIVDQAAPNVIQSNAENAAFHYLATPPNTNPTYDYLITNGRRGDYVPSKTIIDTMLLFQDARISKYFRKAPNGTYSGGVVGKANTYSDLSKLTAIILQPTFEALLMDYSEVEFLLSEAKARGWAPGVVGTARDHYNKAIEASILYWGGTVTDYTNYIAQPSVGGTITALNYKQKIGTQKWIALYNRGFDAWTEIRRLDYPKLPDPLDKVSDFPVRLRYPTQEQTLNGANYSQAAAAIGGDRLTTKLFWDKN